MNIDYDYLLRQLMGIETIYKDGPIHFKYQPLVDNIDLINDQMLKEINDKVFKKKRTGILALI